MVSPVGSTYTRTRTRTRTYVRHGAGICLVYMCRFEVGLDRTVRRLEDKRFSRQEGKQGSPSVLL